MLFKLSSDAEENQSMLSNAICVAMTKRWCMVTPGDLSMLVRCALKADEITLSKAAELLGLDTEDMQVVAANWCAP